MEENSKLWKKILGEIETGVSKANYLTLFRRTSLISFEKEVATIAVPSAMIIDLLRKRFYDVIKKTVDKHTGIDTKIIFIPKTIEAEKNKSAESGPLFVQEERTPTTIGHLPRVRKDYTFQNFAVSSSNQLAYVSAQTVAKKIGESYNPLFIYGPVGVGKTHLMQSIANEVYQNFPHKKISYITSEEFTNEVVEAIRSNDTARMKKRFRDVELLIIDDIQFIAGKERVQEELFHTFNTLVDKDSQIVLSSDRHPSEIKNMEKRLSSRFAGGLAVDISAPDFELRTAILLIKAKKYNHPVSIEVAKKLAEKVQDARGLEGILLRLITIAQAQGVEATTELAEQVLGNKEEEFVNNHPDDVIKSICSFYKTKPTLIKGGKRDASLVKIRQIAMYLLKKDYGLTFVEIGNVLGGRDHTTVMHGVGKIETLLSQGTFASEVLKVRGYVGGKNVD
ncbi:MAG: chromosomal replication initiator protein DnaA [Candidatus Levybacteria bacterium]|nr:chromosomal replication initiator protein DnaA [Candidatus Levybacteria bacterium]